MYIQGFVIPVAAANRAAYHRMAAIAAPVFADHGAIRIVEGWGDDVPAGEVTDFARAVQASEEEVVVFSWIAWADRATCDAASPKIMADPRLETPPEGMPFDGARLIYGGFEAVMEEGPGGPLGYVDGFLAAVPTADRAAYIDHARAAAAFFLDYGATRLVEGWGADIAEGKVTDYPRAVRATADETVVFSWIEWPDKPTRDAGMARIMDEPAMREMAMPFDGRRMIFGGFVPILDTDAAGDAQ